MIIYKNKYRSHWVSPYTILTKVLFWESEDEIYGIRKLIPGEKLDWKQVFEDKETKPYITFLVKALEPLCNGLMKVLDVVHPKIDYVKIDRWDTWSMDCTLAPIILPMLKQLKETKHGVPSSIVHTADGGEIPFKRAEKKWDTILDKMIWSFEQIVDENNDDQFFNVGKYNVVAHRKHEKKIQEGLELFGKHYRDLWD